MLIGHRPYIDTGLDNDKLANTIETIIDNYPKADMSYWRLALRQNEVVGRHQWNNLASLISSLGTLTGHNVVTPLIYCEQRASGIK